MDIHPSIAVKDRESGHKNSYRMDQESIVIGRDRANFIVLQSKSVSRNHAEILFESGSFFIVDLNSGNGTYVNNQRLQANEKMLLRSSDKIQIENFEILFTLNGSAGPDFGEITDTDVLEIKMIKKLLRAVDKDNAPVIEVVGGGHEGKRFILDGKTQEVVVGRDPACEFQIESEVISRKHARVVKKWDTVTIIDLASKNGVFVNDEKINEVVLSDGDRILLGTLPLLYRNPTEHGWDYLAAAPPPKAVKAPAASEASTSDNIGRVARRADSTGTTEQPVESPPEPPQRQEDAPEEMPPQGLPPDAPSAETSTPFIQRFSPLELGAAAIGIAILIGSIWFLLKLL